MKRCALQSSAVLDGTQRRNTKHESAWPFRIWYNFDRKYPLSCGSHTEDPDVRGEGVIVRVQTPEGALSKQLQPLLSAGETWHLSAVL